MRSYLFVVELTIAAFIYVNAEIKVGNQLKFQPPPQSVFLTNTIHQLDICIPQAAFGDSRNASTAYYYIGFRLKDSNKKVSHNWEIRFKNGNDSLGSLEYDSKTLLLEELILSLSNGTCINLITLLARGIGYVSFTADLVQVRGGNQSELVVTSSVYKCTIVREHRIVDYAFEIFVTLLAFLAAFALGCFTELHVIKQELHKRLSLAVACATQYIVLPVVTVSIARALQVQNEVALGFLFTTCVPGGGLGVLMVAITETTDLNLSVTINLIQTALSLGSVPLYVFTLCHLLKNGNEEVPNNIYLLGLWNLILLLSYGGGIMIRRRKPSIADAFLNWIMKPLLLLAFILMGTLGLYINMYVFDVLTTECLIIGGVIPAFGFAVGGLTGLLTRQDKSSAKTISIECAVSNSVIVMVALRFTLPQPDADIISAAAFWMFLVTPIPFILLCIFHRCKTKILSLIEHERNAKKQHDLMLQSFAALTFSAFRMSGMNSTDTSTCFQARDDNEANDQSKLISNNSDQASLFTSKKVADSQIA